MSPKHWAWLSLGVVLAAILAACAPVDPSADTARRKESTAAASAYPTVEPLPSAGPAFVAGNDRLLKERVEAAIRQVAERDLLLNNGFWSVFHGILGLGLDFTLKHPQLGIKISAIDYICDGWELRGLRFLPTEYGLDVEIGEQFVSQGHQDQFVAEMAQCGIPADRKFVVRGKDKQYTFMDFVRHSQMRARVTAEQELSWTIVIVGQYLGTDLTWTNAAGEKLRFEDLVRYEVNASVEQAACGGTHRLFGLQWAYNLHRGKGGKTEGVWKDLAEEQVKYQRLARQFQNADGSFSTDFFRGPGSVADMQLRMNTTGHILEWLAYSLPAAELRQEWVQRAAHRLALMFLEIQSQSMESGSLYHAVHGLRIYHERAFGGDGLGKLKPFLILPQDEAAPGKQSK